MYKHCAMLFAFATFVVALAPIEARADFKDAAALLARAKTFDLYSLDPASRGEGPKGLHGWKVLGKTTLQDKDVRARALAAIEKGVRDSDGSVAGCFRPRHGVRAVVDGKTVELVICFECLSLQVFEDGKRSFALT